MTVDACLLEKARAGRITEARAKAFIEELEENARQTGDDNEAALNTLRDAVRRAQNKKRQRLLSAQKQLQIGRKLDAVDADDKLDAAKALLQFDAKGRFGGENVVATEEFVRGQALGLMADTIEKFRSKTAGLQRAGRDKAGMRALLRELHGEVTGDRTAKNLSEGVKEGFEFLRRRFNEAGGDIRFRKDFGVPHVHDRRAIAAVSFEEWAAFIRPKLDTTRMIDLDTGAPKAAGGVEDNLRQVYEDVITGGLDEVVPGEGGFQVKRSVGNKRQEARFLPFRNADAWLEYQDRFGTGNTFEVIMNHVRGMSRDTALMKVLGPNPDAAMRFIKNKLDLSKAQQAIQAEGKKAVKILDRNPAASLDNLYAEVSGANLIPDRPSIANAGASIRSLTVASQLGGAFLSAITDTTFTALTASWNGFSGTKVAGRLIKNFTTADKTSRLAALRSGFDVDTWTSTLAAQQRFSVDELGAQWTRHVADVVLRGSFLSSWTEAGKVTFQREFLGFLTDNAGREFNQLPELLQRAMKRHGVTLEDWNLARSEPLMRNEDGVDYLHLGGLAARGDQEGFSAANRVQSMILNETLFAVPEGTARTRALLTQGFKPGSFMGEMLRSAVLFKAFPVTLLQTHIFGRMLGDVQANVSDKIGYGAKLFIATTIMGGMALQLKDIAKGKDPRPMTGGKFWAAAIQQGGGLGMMGDFLFADHNRYGGSLTATVAGPVLGGMVEKGQRLTFGNLQELAEEGEAKNWGAELISFGRSLTPGANLWYTRLAFERTVLDNLQKALDPNYPTRFRRIQRRAEREYGQGYFAPPGRGIERAPDLANVFREAP